MLTIFFWRLHFIVIKLGSFYRWVFLVFLGSSLGFLSLGFTYHIKNRGLGMIQDILFLLTTLPHTSILWPVWFFHLSFFIFYDIFISWWEKREEDLEWSEVFICW